MKVFIGSDHNGFLLKGRLAKYLLSAGYDVVDEGDKKLNPDDDFPQFASKVVHAMQASADAEARGILLCSSGQGMCMMANRFKGVRAVLGYDSASVASARNDDDANILCLPASSLGERQANVLAEKFLITHFAAAARYNRRIKEMDEV